LAVNPSRQDLTLLGKNCLHVNAAKMADITIHDWKTWRGKK
jgi:hypothetical protein